MKEFFLRPKVTLITIAVILALILSGVYLYAALRPGVWLNEAFLYQQKDGSFRGSDDHAQYTMQIERQDDDATLTLTINDTTLVYEILCSGRDVQILQDGVPVYDGQVTVIEDVHTLQSNELASTEPTGVVVGSLEWLSPSYGWLYYSAHNQELDTRGQPGMLALAWFFAIVLLLDICFPDLFFRLKYWLYVDGGEPSDSYRALQAVRWGIWGFCIVFILFKGFYRS